MDEPITRRDFLGKSSRGLAVLGLGLATDGLLLLPAYAKKVRHKTRKSKKHVTKSHREMQAELRFRDIICNKTNDEQGHDEIYVIVSGVNPNGTVFSRLFPDPDNFDRAFGSADNGHSLDFNNRGSEQKKTLSDHPIWAEPFEVGQSARVIFSFYESDSQEWSHRVHAAAEAAKSISKNPYAIAIGTVVSQISTHIPKNTDDFIGAYAIDMKWVSDTDKELTRTITPGHGTVSNGASFVGSYRDPNMVGGRMGPEWEFFTMNLTGDGSNYDVETYLRMIRRPD